MKAVILWKKTI